uniref:Uncharacterized protein n=1 Tax=Setaria viridis TaxID=4556 RepID=A0A4U6WIA8_SETVI|nr:hypothetical protein SEVIR_1G347900v2 [Setaria viridis]
MEWLGHDEGDSAGRDRSLSNSWLLPIVVRKKIIVVRKKGFCLSPSIPLWCNRSLQQFVALHCQKSWQIKSMKWPFLVVTFEL